MNCNGNCPYTRPYFGPGYSIQQPIPMGTSPRPDESPVEYFKRAERELKEMKEAFKTEPKKDENKKKAPTFTFLETFGLLMVGGIFMGIAQMKLIAYFAASLQSFPH
jgi:hypothetical protein